MSAQPARVLRAARNLIEAGWCKSHEAETADYQPVAFDSDVAVRWCMAGAVLRAAMPRPLGEDAYWALAALWRAATGSDAKLGHEAGSYYIDRLASWSKHLDRTHADVLEAFDRAITSAEEWEADVAFKEARARLVAAKLVEA